MRNRFDHPQLVSRDRGAELRSKPSAAPALRVHQRVADLRDGQRRDY
jgi:hypothetical protein